MPPVLGPVSPTPTRLKSCAASSGTTVSPSPTQNSDTSGPSRKDSSSTGCPDSSNPAAWARATSRSGVTTTPLPAANRSSFTTQARSPAGGPNRSRAASKHAGLSTISLEAVRTPAAAITSLAKALDPSISAAALLGPKQAMPASRTASATPSTNGTSGPMTTRSARISRANATTSSPEAISTSCWSAIAAVPALPGAMATASTCGSARNASKRACSRAPAPITRTRTKRHSSGGTMRAVKRQSDDFFEQVFQFFLLHGSETPETLGELLRHRRQAARGGFASGLGEQQAMAPTIGRIGLAAHEAGRLQPFEVPGDRRLGHVQRRRQFGGVRVVIDLGEQEQLLRLQAQ